MRTTSTCVSATASWSGGELGPGNIGGNYRLLKSRDPEPNAGANKGGKSTFLRSVGSAQLMMQCGLFVTAGAFRANLRRGLLTHYKREEDASMTSGKYEEELDRIDGIVEALTPYFLVLFNESFAATNEREGMLLLTDRELMLVSDELAQSWLRTGKSFKEKIEKPLGF